MGGGGARKKILILLVFNDLKNLGTLSVQEAIMKTKDVMPVSIFLSLHIHTCVGNLRTCILELLNFWSTFVLNFKDCILSVMDGARSTCRGENWCVQCFGGEIWRKETLGRPRLRWEDNINMGLQEVG